MLFHVDFLLLDVHDLNKRKHSHQFFMFCWANISDKMKNSLINLNRLAALVNDSIFLTTLCIRRITISLSYLYGMHSFGAKLKTIQLMSQPFVTCWFLN